MSLEEALKAHTVALEANTIAVTRNTELLQGALAARGAAPAADTKTSTTSAETKTAAGAAAEPKPRGRPPKDKKTDNAPTIEELRAKAAEYLNVKNADEKEKRKAKVAPMLEHFGVARVTEIPADNYGEAIGYFNTLINGGTLNFSNEGAEEGVEDDGDII